MSPSIIQEKMLHVRNTNRNTFKPTLHVALGNQGGIAIIL